MHVSLCQNIIIFLQYMVINTYYELYLYIYILYFYFNCSWSTSTPSYWQIPIFLLGSPCLNWMWMCRKRKVFYLYFSRSRSILFYCYWHYKNCYYYKRRVKLGSLKFVQFMIIVPYELKHIKYNCILNILTFSPLAPEAPTAPGCPTSPCKDKQQVPVLIN